MRVEGLGGLGRLLRVVQLGVHVVFDQRHLMALQQRHQCLFLRLGHARAHRVLEVGHAPHGFDRVLLQGLGERGQVHAFARLHGYLHCLELEPFQHLEAGVEGRCFDRHQVTRLGDRLQAQVQGFQPTRTARCSGP
ncbi:hypothetical protein D3C79_846780 [compost metagenome]